MIRRAWFAGVLFLVPGCGLTGFEEGNRLEPEEIEALIASAPYPELTPAAEPVQPSKITIKPDGRRSIEIDLNEALRLSLKNNQGWLGRTEGIDLQLLSLEVLRRSWWPMQSPLSGTVSWGKAIGGDPSTSEGLSIGVSQKLPYGASANFSASESGSQGPGPNSYSGGYSAGVSLPLFRGGGWRIGIESKIAAERGYVYSKRSYDYARTDLLIQTVQSYFGQLQQEVSIANLERSLASARRGAELSNLQFGRGLVPRNDVFRADLAVTSAENALVNAREQARLALDAFKIDLGLRPEDELVLVKEKIEFKTLEINADEAIKAAFATNPSWLNARDQFDDAGRALEIAGNATLPSVNLGASYSWSGVPTTRPFEEFETSSRSLGVSASFSLDLERSSLNQSYQAAVIGYRQSMRGFQRARDGIARTTQDLLTTLRQAEISMKLQDRARNEARRNLELIEDQYERGRVDNVNVISARDQKVAAENAYEAQLVSAKVTQLKLLQWIGRLEPDDEGRWFR
jgi:outer membrane protein TolC